MAWWQGASKGKKMGVGCLGTLGLLMVCGICGGIASAFTGNTSSTDLSQTNSQSQSSSTTQQQAQAPTPTDTPAPPTATPKPITWHTTQTFSGNGDQKTVLFNVDGTWRIEWSCVPSSSFGGSYNVMADVDYSDGTPGDMGAINTICQHGNTSGVTNENGGQVTGQVYLDITSEAVWKMVIQEYS